MKGIEGWERLRAAIPGSMAERPEELPAAEVCFGEVWRLGAAATAGGKLANVIEEDGALEGVELRGVESDFCDEGIGHKHGRLIFMACVRVAKEDGDVDLESVCETRERGQRGHGLAVLDLGDVGARHPHAAGELALGEVTDMTQIADGGCDLDAPFGYRNCGNKGERQRYGLRCFDLERPLTAGTGGCGTAELHKIAMITAQDLTLFNRSHHGCHRYVVRGRLPERGTAAHVR